MRLTGRTLDDLLRKLLPKLLSSKNHISSKRLEGFREIFGVLLELGLPRARLSRTETRGKPFSCLGEFLWYLSRDNRLDFISFYIEAYQKESDDGKTIFGGYGPRIFKQRDTIDQLDNVMSLLSTRPQSKRAVIQIFNAEDINHVDPKNIPCTCTLQFLVRGQHLHLLTTMRSNDAYIGLPHDVFCFTMLQEVVARTLHLKLGKYRHFVGSMHLYDKHEKLARQYLKEDIQPTVLMPLMPLGNPWPALTTLLAAEQRIRLGSEFDAETCGLPPYWTDLVRLLQAFAASGKKKKIEALKDQMHFKKYSPYIDTRKTKKPRTFSQPNQYELQF